MAVSVTDARRVKRWSERLVPPEFRERVRVVSTAERLHVQLDILRKSAADAPWRERPAARLRFTESTGLWTLFWFDEHGKSHEHRGQKPARDVRVLLDYIARGDDPIFGLHPAALSG